MPPSRPLVAGLKDFQREVLEETVRRRILRKLLNPMMPGRGHPHTSESRGQNKKTEPRGPLLLLHLLIFDSSDAVLASSQVAGSVKVFDEGESLRDFADPALLLETIIDLIHYQTQPHFNASLFQSTKARPSNHWARKHGWSSRLAESFPQRSRRKSTSCAEQRSLASGPRRSMATSSSLYKPSRRVMCLLNYKSTRHTQKN